MNRFVCLALACNLTLLAGDALAQASQRIRGTITAVDGNVLQVKSRSGEDLRLQLADNLTVAVARPVRFEDLKPGDYVGSAAMKRPDGTLVALEVHYLAAAVPEGHTPWDLQPGSTMTNAYVSSAMVQSAGVRELVLKHKDGEQRILVPDGVPIVRTVPGGRGDLAVGEYIFAAAQAAPDGKLTLQRIQVSKDGVRPPQ